LNTVLPNYVSRGRTLSTRGRRDLWFRRSRLWAILTILLVWPLVTTAALGASSRLIIKKITVEGNSYFSDDQIRDQMMLKANRWYNFFRKRRFSSKRAEVDKAAIDSLYHVHGFLQAECSVEPVEKTKSTCW